MNQVSFKRLYDICIYKNTEYKFTNSTCYLIIGNTLLILDADNQSKGLFKRLKQEVLQSISQVYFVYSRKNIDYVNDITLVVLSDLVEYIDKDTLSNIHFHTISLYENKSKISYMRITTFLYFDNDTSGDACTPPCIKIPTDDGCIKLVCYSEPFLDSCGYLFIIDNEILYYTGTKDYIPGDIAAMIVGNPNYKINVDKVLLAKSPITRLENIYRSMYSLGLKDYIYKFIPVSGFSDKQIEHFEAKIDYCLKRQKMNYSQEVILI